MNSMAGLSSYDRSMRVKYVVVILVAASFGGALPAGAAAKTYAPPGKAGTSEYSETLPASGGNVAPPAMTGGNPTGAQLSALGSGQAGARKLEKLGKQGQSAAAFAQATAPTRLHGSHLSAPAKNAAGQVESPGGSAISGVLHVLGGSDSGGIGVFLPLLLAFGLGVAVTVGVWTGLRRRQPRL